MRFLLPFAALAGVLTTSSGLYAIPAFAQNQNISVVVNQVPVSFTGAPPEEINNSVLVPLRGVFEQLGASVDYNAATQQIQSKKGSIVVVLTIGQATAFVNGNPQTLNQPAVVIDGTTLVPLRFVAQAFGADVAWLPSTHTVEINTVDQHINGLPSPPVDANDVATGALTGIFPNTEPPEITMRVNGENTAVPYSNDTIVLIQHGDAPATQLSVQDLRIGDQVHVAINGPGGSASIIRVRYDRIIGTVKSIAPNPDGSAVITLNDGQTIQVAPDAHEAMAGRPIHLSDIMPNDRVVIHIGPDKTAYFIDEPTHLDNGPGGNGETPAQNGAAASSASITSFFTDANRPLRAGDKIQATLKGTPGLHAVFSIPGVVDSVPMHETSPGVYEGSYTVSGDANINGGSALAQLRAPGEPASSSPMIQAAQVITIDNKPPKISGENPPDGSEVATNRPRIYAVTDDDGGTGVDKQATRIELDGQDVTGSAIVTASFVTYQPEGALAAGSHKVTVTASDLAGNQATLKWTFNVSPNQDFVHGISSNLQDGAPLTAGQTLIITLHAQTGGAATFSVGSVATDIPMKESSPGVYTGKYIPEEGGSAAKAIISARYVAPNGSVISSTLDNPVTIDAGIPEPPKVISPVNGDHVDGTITVRGKAVPGTIVIISVTYKTNALGGLLPVTGHAAEAQVKVDHDGNWNAGEIKLNSTASFAAPKDTTYVLSAICQDADGQQSNPTLVSFKHA